MTKQEVITILTEFNKYRRGEYDTYRDFESETGITARDIGIALDMAVKLLSESDTKLTRHLVNKTG